MKHSLIRLPTSIAEILDYLAKEVHNICMQKKYTIKLLSTKDVFIIYLLISFTSNYLKNIPETLTGCIKHSCKMMESIKEKTRKKPVEQHI